MCNYHHCRLLLPIARSGRCWEAILVTPRFLLVAPGWQAAVTYLMSLTGGSSVGVMLLLASQLRLIMRGQTYIESLVGPFAQSEACTCGMHVLLESTG
jgi:hypothetical protein